MDYPHGVDVLKTLAEVLVPAGRLLLRNITAFKRVPERTWPPGRVEYEVHHVVRKPTPRVYVHVVHAHNARMGKPCKEASLHVEPLAQELHIPVVERERLQRETRAEPLILHFIHLGHPALPEQTRDAVRSDLSSSFKHLALLYHKSTRCAESHFT